MEEAKAIKDNYIVNIQIVENPDRYVSHGFNKSFKYVKGKYIALIGAHTIYPSNYLVDSIKIINQTDCSAVGGPLKHLGKGLVGKVIASCLSTKFGIGNVDFRVKSSYGYVDSVPFAVYKKKFLII